MAEEMAERLDAIQSSDAVAAERLWRFRRKDGRIAVIRASSVVTLDAAGRPAFILSRASVVDPG
jgi:PAS domain-containing protein